MEVQPLSGRYYKLVASVGSQRRSLQIGDIGGITTPVSLQIGDSGGIRIKTVEIRTKTKGYELEERFYMFIQKIWLYMQRPLRVKFCCILNTYLEPEAIASKLKYTQRI